MRYLYTGDDSPDGWAEARRRILENLGRSVRSIGFQSFIFALGRRPGNLQCKLGTGPGIWSYNRALIAAAKEFRPDVFWVDKGSLVQAETLRKVRELTGAVIVNFNTDYLGCGNHPWRLHREGIPEYDVYLTSNVFDVDYLKSRGVKDVVVVPLGYYGAMFGEVELTPDDERRLGADVGFIGHWEPATEKLVLELLERGLPLRVRGSSWHKARAWSKLRGAVESTWIPQSDFVKCIRATRINLGINSTMNRNQASGRSFEIPAAGGFLLAKRSEEHLAMYEEGKEAEFWDSAEELVEKATYYLAHDEERRSIAENGRRRLRASGTSFEEMMAGLVEKVEAAVPRKI